jgi:ABC-type Na+ transport system ATPase subunit NatA
MYGSLVAVDDVSVSVAEGEIFGILGPNPRADRAELLQVVGVQLRASAFRPMRFFRWE